MSEDVIKVVVDRSQLEEFITQLDSAIGGGGVSGSSGVGRRIGQPKTDMWKQSITMRNLQQYNQFMQWQTRPDWLDYNTLKTIQNFKGTTYNMPKRFSQFMQLNQQILNMPTRNYVQSPYNWMGFASPNTPQATTQVAKKSIRDIIVGLQTPSFNREQRIILNQLGFPTRAFYDVKRFQKGVAAGLLSSPTGLLTVAATILLIYEQVQRIQANLEQKETEYKNIFLEYKPDMTNKEFQRIKDQQHDIWGKMMNYIFRGK